MPTIDISITIPADVVAAITAWRQKQVVGYDQESKPILKYPTNLALLQGVIKDTVQRILESEPTSLIQAELDKIEVAKQIIVQLKEQAVE